MRTNALLGGIITGRGIPSQFWRGAKAPICSSSFKTSSKSSSPSLLRNHPSAIGWGHRSSAFIPLYMGATPVRPNKSVSTTSVPSTDAQVSRAAAKAVRMCVRAGELADAYYIFNSIQCAPNVFPPQQKGLEQRINVPCRPFIPLRFNPTVSPRLVAHSLLHGLLRVGLTTKAYQLAGGLIEDGIKIQPRSLEAVMHGLIAQGATPPGIFESRRLNQITKIVTSRQVLTLRPRFALDPSTRYAVRLILRSRHNRQKCTSEAYHSIIRYLLQRAEILVASLLFCTLVKDYQIRQTLAARLRGQIQSVGAEDQSDQAHVEHKAGLQTRLKDVIWQKGVIDIKMATSLVQTIEAAMLQDPHQTANGVSQAVSLQALANIAMLLDERQIPFPEVASIIRALYSCPRSNKKVWIIVNGKVAHVRAYSYFHSVLIRLAVNLPTNKPLRRLAKTDPDNAPLPPLDLNSYNSLLYYALRHRQDPFLAGEVLRHMRNRSIPLHPDITTYNILIRSGTLLREVGISNAALESLRRHSRNALHGIMITPSAEDTEAQQRRLHSVGRSPKRAPSRWRTLDPLDHLESQLMSFKDQQSDLITADGYTLTSYIMHLTSTGCPHVVADILFHVLPELSMVDHPSWGPMTTEESRTLRTSRIYSRRKLLRRAASLGPNFFAAILNALGKAGMTGLTERVWILAKRAERISWMAGGISPWLLPVHAYTAMLQCYAAEGRKGLAMYRSGRSCQRAEDQRHDWQPLSKRYVRGWARFILSQKLITRDTPRHLAARRTGRQLYMSMKDAAGVVFNDLMRLKPLQKSSNFSIPRPDARFFNAAIELFVHNKPRAKRTRQSQWHMMLQRAQVRYARSGSTISKPNSMVQTIAQEMVQCGFSIPVGLRPLLAGHMSSLAMFQGKRQTLDQRPFAFPNTPGRFQPHGLVTFKTRGLPFRRPRDGRSRSKRHIANVFPKVS